MARRSNGEGSIYHRKDGRWEGALYVLTTSGVRKRHRLYGRTQAEVRRQLVEAKAQQQRGVVMPDKVWLLGEYLDYWLAEVVKLHRRLTTYQRYETAVRLYLKPSLGKHRLAHLPAATVQAFFNERLQAGQSVRSVQILREVLRAALSRAHKEELVRKNVASLIELPTWERTEIEPWTRYEAQRFLRAAQADPLYPAFLLLLLYGLRRGEVLGLRWCDVQLDAGVLQVRQQLQRVAGAIHQGPVKTRAGRRDLPLLELARLALLRQRARQEAQRRETSSAWAGEAGATGLIMTTRTGHPIEPRNLVRSFQRICQQHGIRLITVHQVRHTTATLLKDLGVPARDTQLILGHSDIAITQQIYQHTDMSARRTALTQIETALQQARIQDENNPAQDEDPEQPEVVVDGNLSRQLSRQTAKSIDKPPKFYYILSEVHRGIAQLVEHWSPKSTGATWIQRATVVKAAANARKTRWLLGTAAVSLAVRHTR